MNVPVFVQRKAGQVVGVFTRPQPGVAEEAVDEASDEVRTFRVPVESVNTQNDALERLREILTPQALAKLKELLK